jgi:hypothetical protein
VVVITAAPFDAPAPPTVEPTAQHELAVGQSKALRELTGAGSATGVNAPNHGEPLATGVPDRGPDGDVPALQAPATATTNTSEVTGPRR